MVSDSHGPQQTIAERDEPKLNPMSLAFQGQTRPIQVTVVIPLHDEEQCLPALWSRLRTALESLGQSWEVVYVDDGSKDGSLDLLLKMRAADPRVRILALGCRSGQSAALAVGFRAARGEWIVTLDADLQNPPEEIPRLFEAVEGVDLVYGKRRRRVDSWIKKLSSRIGNGTRNIITGHRVSDTGCSLKLLRREALLRVPLFHGAHRFLPTLFAFHDLKIREIVVDHHARAAGLTKYGILNRAWRGLLDCLAVRWLRGRSLKYEAHEIGEQR
jgi:glycosyltransferase involved in cell wall biosynthesis